LNFLLQEPDFPGTLLFEGIKLWRAPSSIALSLFAFFLEWLAKVYMIEKSSQHISNQSAEKDI
jgi:hypothetical protein